MLRYLHDLHCALAFALVAVLSALLFAGGLALLLATRRPRYAGRHRAQF